MRTEFYIYVFITVKADLKRLSTISSFVSVVVVYVGLSDELSIYISSIKQSM